MLTLIGVALLTPNFPHTVTSSQVKASCIEMGVGGGRGDITFYELSTLLLCVSCNLLKTELDSEIIMWNKNVLSKKLTELNFSSEPQKDSPK